MKCKTLKELEVFEANAPAQLVAQAERRGKSLWLPAGSTIDDPNCFYLVLMHVAEAADDECRQATIQTPEQRAAAERAQKRLSLGIHPDDAAAFDAGEFIGYDANGFKIPGPNAPKSNEDEEEDE